MKRPLPSAWILAIATSLLGCETPPEPSAAPSAVRPIVVTGGHHGKRMEPGTPCQNAKLALAFHLVLDGKPYVPNTAGSPEEAAKRTETLQRAVTEACGEKPAAAPSGQ